MTSQSAAAPAATIAMGRRRVIDRATLSAPRRMLFAMLISNGNYRIDIFGYRDRSRAAGRHHADGAAAAAGDRPRPDGDADRGADRARRPRPADAERARRPRA